MRDPKRIEKFCQRLAAAWRTMPDMRFGQLMVCILGKMASEGRDPFFPEEDEMIRRIEDYCYQENPLIRPTSGGECHADQ